MRKQLIPHSEKVKKKYLKPFLKHHGKVKNITLKTGSVADFGSNQFQP